jgi:hypothetical protein
MALRGGVLSLLRNSGEAAKYVSKAVGKSSSGCKRGKWVLVSHSCEAAE